MVGGSQVAGIDIPGLLALVVVLAVVLFPLALGRPPSTKPPPSDSEDGPDGPRLPPRRPDPPLGGVPLPHAEQSSLRLRDHVRPERGRIRRSSRRVPSRCGGAAALR